MQITKDTLYPFLMYGRPIPYNESITLYPVTMEHILEFNQYSQAITVRKNSRFPDKQIIRMSYLEFLLYGATHPEFGDSYDMPELKNYYSYLLFLLDMVCPGQEVRWDRNTGLISINQFEITPPVLDDLRRIIIIQNDIDFDIDEFLNYDTEKRLQKAQRDLIKHQDKAGMEDYIDSLCIALHLPVEEIMHMTIRKFWRFIKRFNLHENYTFLKSGEYSGMISLKEPVRHWMIALDGEDKYSSLKTDEQALKSKIG